MALTRSEDRVVGAVECGRARRLRRLFSHPSGRVVFVPLDDSLLAGPTNGLARMRGVVERIVAASPQAVMGFQGLLRSHAGTLATTPTLLNVSGSTTRSSHTRKTIVGSVELACRLDCQAVAVHVNIGSGHETEMLRDLGEISRECDVLGMPLLGIMYPRREGPDGDDNLLELKALDRKAYTAWVAHAARVGCELGADIVKTQFTGDVESFRAVVEACDPIPVVVAGGASGPASDALAAAAAAVAAGGAGVSFGRNVFSRTAPDAMVAALRALVLDGKDQAAALEIFERAGGSHGTCS